jgi:hypothetical protein
MMWRQRGRSMAGAIRGDADWAGGTVFRDVRQISVPAPDWVIGLVYWYAIVPLHHVVFRGMLHGIEPEAIRIAATESAHARP